MIHRSTSMLCTVPDKLEIVGYGLAVPGGEGSRAAGQD